MTSVSYSFEWGRDGGSRSHRDGLRVERLFVGGPEEHAVGDHGEEQRGHAGTEEQDQDRGTR